MNKRSLRSTLVTLVVASVVLNLERSTQAAQPLVRVQPLSQTVLVFEPAVLRVSAAGTAPLSYQWRRNGVALVDDGRFSGTGTNLLRIAEFLPADAGDYSVVVTNAEGSTVSSNALMTVAERVQIRRFAGSPLWADGSFHLSAATFRGWPGLILEASEDLLHWEPLLTNTVADGLAEMVVPTGGRISQFYRVQLPDAVTLTILGDNYCYAQGTSADWGFSCLLEGTAKTVLFDTGGTASSLFANMAKLRMTLAAIDEVVISHDHWDHTAALDPILQTNHQVTVWLPYSASTATRALVERSGAILRQERAAVPVCQNVYLSGELVGTVANEQALILETPQGLVVIVGCSHPGIVSILERVKQQRNREIYWVIGGFHLIDNQGNDLPRSEILSVIEGVKNLGVKKCSATHCTGGLAISLFKEAFGEDYEAVGTGRTLVFPR